LIRFRALVKKELATLFASPLAYLALTLVMLVTALIFFDYLRIYNQILFLYSSNTMGGFESGTIPDHINVRDSVFFPVLENLGITLIALIPVITMRVFAEERARGTDELLLTAGITPGQIVLGKFAVAFAFVALMMLVEEGKVALDDPVHRFIPSWRNLGVYVGGGGGLPGTPPGWLTKPTDAPMRMIDLLRHTSGLTYGFQNRTNVDAAYRALKIDTFARDDGLQGFVDALADIPLEFFRANAFADGFMAMPLEVLMRFGRWDEILAEPAFPEFVPISRSLQHYARGVAFAAKDRVPEAEHELQAFLEARTRVAKEASFGNNSGSDVLDVAEHVLRSMLQLARQIAPMTLRLRERSAGWAKARAFADAGFELAGARWGWSATAMSAGRSRARAARACR